VIPGIFILGMTAVLTAVTVEANQAFAGEFSYPTNRKFAPAEPGIKSPESGIIPKHIRAAK
jgi:hypothetical protein